MPKKKDRTARRRVLIGGYCAAENATDRLPLVVVVPEAMPGLGICAPLKSIKWREFAAKNRRVSTPSIT